MVKLVTSEVYVPRRELEERLRSAHLPYLRLGHGTPQLLVLPGINDALQSLQSDAKFAEWLCGGLAIDRTVFVVGRPRGLRPSATLAGMADTYALALRDEIERADVLGVSMGSAIAEELAAASPERVRRLILALAGPYVHPEKRSIYDRWLALARANRWRELHLDIIGVIYGPRRRAAFSMLLPAGDRYRLAADVDPQDFVVSIQACLNHDSRSVLGRIRAPTLVLGGTDDPLVPAGLFESLAETIPGGSLRLFEGAGHGLPEERRDEFQGAVLEFLNAP